jgi:hypothetical protein
MSDDDEMVSNGDTVTITGSSSSTCGTIDYSTMVGNITIPTLTTNTTGNGFFAGGGGGIGTIGNIGTTGSYFTSTGTGAAPVWTTIPPNTKTVFRTHNGDEVSVEEIIDMMKIMKERLLILTPLFEKHEKYAALKKAYENYKLIEALIQEENKNDK